MSGILDFGYSEVFRALATILFFVACYQTLLICLQLAVDMGTVARRSLSREKRERSEIDRVIRGLGAAFEPLAAIIPERIIDRNERRMIFAGRPHGGVTAKRYFAAALALGFAVSAISLAAYLSLGEGAVSVLTVVGIIAAGPFGAYLVASVKLDSDQEVTRVDVVNEFPFFLDLAVLVVQAGGTPLDAFEEYIKASPDTLLAQELTVTMKDAEATSMDMALLRLCDRIESSSVQNIIRNLAQAERTTGKLSAFYLDQAIELRSIRQELAEAAAERIRQMIKIPEVMIAIAITLATTGPSIIQMGLF